MSDSVELQALPKRERLYPERGNAAIYGYTADQMHAFYAKGWNDALRAQVPDEVDAFLGEVRAELIRARTKFPGDRIMTIALAEEFGELCKAILDESAANVRKEAVQTAVMAARVVLDGDGSVADWRRERGLDQLVSPGWHDRYDLASYGELHGIAAAPAAPQSGCDGTCYRSPQGLCATHDAEAHGEAAKPSSEAREVADVAGTDEHLGFIEYCGDMLRKLGKPMLGGSLRHTAETLRLRFAEQPQPDSRGEG